MKYPNFFIIGAAKSGTSSLWQYLKQHPKIFMPENELYKEPGFFSNIRTKKKNIDKYLKIFKDAKKQHILIGEASTAYLTDPSSAKNIYNFNQQAKIIIILRNPMERAYSLYRWMAQEGYEYAPTFETALDLEKNRINKTIPNFFEPEYYYNYLYFNSGLYYQQVKQYLDLFEHRNVHIIKFDDFKNDFEKTYIDLCSFLEIKKNAVSPKIFNKSKSIFSPTAQFILRKINNFLNKHFKKKSQTKESRDKLMKLGIINKKHLKISEQTKQLLTNKYKQDIKNLSKLTKINLNNWL